MPTSSEKHVLIFFFPSVLELLLGAFFSVFSGGESMNVLGLHLNPQSWVTATGRSILNTAIANRCFEITIKAPIKHAAFARGSFNCLAHPNWCFMGVFSCSLISLSLINHQCMHCNRHIWFDGLFRVEYLKSTATKEQVKLEQMEEARFW